jgi:hypothetical protein
LGCVWKYAIVGAYAYYESHRSYASAIAVAMHAPVLRWRWRRLHQQPERDVIVRLEHTDAIETIRMATCVTSSLAQSIRRSLTRWFRDVPLDTVRVAYRFDGMSMHNTVPLVAYFLRHVVGFYTTTPSPSLRAAVRQSALLRNDIVFDALQQCTQFVGGHAASQSVAAADARALAQICEAYHQAVLPRLSPGAPPGAPPGASHQPVAGRTRVAEPPGARNERFYYKMQRILQHPSGIAYLKGIYAESRVFRHQFHKCRGFCYYKLLFKLKELRLHRGNFSPKKWTDLLRDTYTSVSEGDVFHTCNRCGDKVCRQESGLLKEYDAVGQSSTHSEFANSNSNTDFAAHASDSANSRTPPLTISQRSCLQHVCELLETRNLASHQNLIFDLPLTPDVRELLKRAHVFVTGTNLRGVIHEGAYNEPLVLKIVSFAAIAVHDAINRLQQKTSNVTVPRKRTDVKIIASFAPYIVLSAKSLSNGIPPRHDFRPHLTPDASVQHNGPEWDGVYAESNNRPNHLNNVFDWTTWQHTGALYERNDIYLCVNRPIVDTDPGANGYTSLSKLVNPLIGTNSVAVGASDRCRLAVALPSNGLPELSGRTVPLTIVGARNASGRDVEGRQSRTHPDVRRRGVIYKHVHPSSTGGAYPHTLQSVIDRNRVEPADVARQLHCLVGIVVRQKLRLSTNPCSLVRTEWVDSYLQLHSTNLNEKVVGLLRAMHYKFDRSFESNPRLATLRKFV